jgi:hypothetical protein
MSDDLTAPRPPPIGLLALLILGIALYAATIGSIADLGSSDAAGRALGKAFGVIFGFGLWIVLAAMVVIGGVNGKMPVWAGIAAATWCRRRPWQRSSPLNSSNIAPAGSSSCRR